MPAFTSIALAVTAAAAAASAYGTIKSSEDQSDAMNQDAQLKELQAQEVEREQGARVVDEDINNQKTLGQMREAFGESGLTSGGSALYALEGTYADMQRQQVEEQKEADYKAMQIRAGASVESQQASDLATSGYINAGAGLVKSTGTILSLTGRATTPPPPSGGGGGSPSYYSALS